MFLPVLLANNGGEAELVQELRVISTVLVVCSSAALTLFLHMLIKRRKAIKSLNNMVTLATRVAEIPTYRSAVSQLAYELERARRYERPLTVLVLSFTREERKALSQDLTNPRRIALHDLVLRFPLLGCVLRDALRDSDVVAYDAAVNRYVIGLVEIDKERASGLVQRLQTTAQQSSLPELRMGAASFPQDGLTLDDLIDEAQAACDAPVKSNVSAFGKIA